MTINPIEFVPGYFTGKPRPSYNSECVLHNAAESIMEEVMSWFGPEEDEEKEIFEALKKVINNHDDGYSMAKQLEDDHHWYDVNSELVDILDGISLYSERRAAVLAWIRDNNVKPLFEKGAVVKVRYTGDSFKPTIIEGTIIENKEGDYIINCPSLGHTKGSTGTRGIILTWDEVEALNDNA